MLYHTAHGTPSLICVVYCTTALPTAGPPLLKRLPKGPFPSKGPLPSAHLLSYSRASLVARVGSCNSLCVSACFRLTCLTSFSPSAISDFTRGLWSAAHRFDMPVHSWIIACQAAGCRRRRVAKVGTENLRRTRGREAPRRHRRRSRRPAARRDCSTNCSAILSPRPVRLIPSLSRRCGPSPGKTPRRLTTTSGP